MYTKNLTEDLRLRLSKSDMDFLRVISENRQISISECIRSIIGEYRRSLETIDLLAQAVNQERIKECQELLDDDNDDLKYW